MKKRDASIEKKQTNPLYTDSSLQVTAINPVLTLSHISTLLPDLFVKTAELFVSHN